MRIVTSARLRAVGTLLLELAGFAALVAQHVHQDDNLRGSALRLAKKAKDL